MVGGATAAVWASEDLAGPAAAVAAGGEVVGREMAVVGSALAAAAAAARAGVAAAGQGVTAASRVGYGSRERVAGRWGWAATATVMGGAVGRLAAAPEVKAVAVEWEAVVREHPPRAGGCLAGRR